jgi:hypothetical protein
MGWFLPVATVYDFCGFTKCQAGQASFWKPTNLDWRSNVPSEDQPTCIPLLRLSRSEGSRPD